jgi:hypothetical protein
LNGRADRTNACNRSYTKCKARKEDAKPFETAAQLPAGETGSRAKRHYSAAFN